MPSVSRLSVAPVKGLALLHPEEVTIGPNGVAENRRFFLVDERGKLVTSLKYGRLVQVRAEYEPVDDELSLCFPDGRAVAGRPKLGGRMFTAFWGRPVHGRLVEGPWSDALSEHVGKPLRLVRADEPGGGYDAHAVSLLGDASLAELARRSGANGVDGRRFRMLVGLAETRPHEEDEWIGRRVRIGGAVVRVAEPNARCATTTHHPETGVRDFDTLRAIKAYRGVRDGKRIDFGVYADVEEPGRVRVGDPVEPE